MPPAKTFVSDHCRSRHPALPREEFTGKKKRIRSLDVLAHRGRHLEHRAAVPEAVDLADGAALVDALLLDVGPERLEHLAAGGLAVDAGDLRQGGGERHRLEDALAGLLLLGGILLARGDLALGLVLALAALAVRAEARLLLLFLLALLLLLLRLLLLLLRLLRLLGLAGLLLLRLRGDLRAGEALLDRGLHHGGVNNHGKLLGGHHVCVQAKQMRYP